MIILSKQQVIALHTQLIGETGGIDGIRDESLLESALNAPFQSFGGQEMFPSIPQKAARLGYGIIKNHAFLDGNKRIGTHIMLVFLALNKVELYYTQKELRKTLDKYGIRLMSWYPLGHGDKSLINEPVFAELGEKYGKTPAQVILRWHTQMGFAVIPGSRNVDHIRDNLNILDFELTDEEMKEIAKLDKDQRYYHRTDEQLIQFAAWRPEFER